MKPGTLDASGKTYSTMVALHSQLTTLGGFAFTVNGVSTPGPATRKARALMAFLIMNRHSDAARERLLEIFWPDAEPERARDSLKTAVWSIRRCLRTAGADADQFLQTTKSTLRWTGDTSVDALQFVELAQREDATQAALELFHGDFLEGDYDNWAVAERERLASVYESLLARVVKTSKDAQAAQLFIQRNPYDEDAYAALIEVELAAGRRASAVTWVERCRTALSEIGEKPSAAFETKFGGIVHVEPAVQDELRLPFTGRDTELGLLAAKIADAAAGQGTLTIIHGEAGIGKSTLLERVSRMAQEQGLRIIHIRCTDETRDAFGPWRAVFQAVGAMEFDTFVRVSAGAVPAAIAQAIVTRLVEPTTIIVDDAHELAGDALDILAVVARTASIKHAVFIGSRPEGVVRFRSILSDAEFEEVLVGRLNRHQLQWALTQALGKELPELLEPLYDRSHGHPLFFTGLLNSLVDEGVLARERREWRLVKRITTDMELPDTLRRFIEARLGARGQTARAVACALALEPAASADDLIAVLKWDESAVLDALDDLLALGLIAQPLTGPQFAFTHDLIREVAALGLNAGRRTMLHRAFAQRLANSGELEASQRLARHFEAAGDWLSAAQSYYKSAQAALELNAAQDAICRCDTGLLIAGKLERTLERDLVIARLHRTSARAAAALGEMDDAIKRAREAVTAARSAENLDESSRAILDLAVMEGAAFQADEQRADALEAARNAAVSGDRALEAEALVQLAAAQRHLGAYEESLKAARSAREVADSCGRPSVAAAAVEEILRTQITCWQFSDALASAREALDLARRACALVEASVRHVRCLLWYLLDRFEEAGSELGLSLRAAEHSAIRHAELMASPTQSLPLIRFQCSLLAAKIANEQKEWERALGALRDAQAITSLARQAHYAAALCSLQIDTLLRRNEPGDVGTAVNALQELERVPLGQHLLSGSNCVVLSRARIAARCGNSEARELALNALNVLEENAHRAPLESDRAFALLAGAAEEIQESAVAIRARERSKYYGSARRAAAGAAWGTRVNQ